MKIKFHVLVPNGPQLAKCILSCKKFDCKNLNTGYVCDSEN